MTNVLKIYFDACCYSRPFDDLSSEKVRLEAEAILMIQGKASNGLLKLYSSRIIDFELDKIKDLHKKVKVSAFYSGLTSEILKFCSCVEEIADNLEGYNIKYMDALHIAFCEKYKIDYMLTTDQILLNSTKRADINTRVINPLHFIMEVL